MQQEVEGNDDLRLSQLPNGYRQKKVKIYDRDLSQGRNQKTLREELSHPMWVMKALAGRILCL